ncbi:MAG: polyprenyl synthetase family protein [Blastocatellia bacterium]|nr:polyprenyl synthetase family protein [Blastocatellia bacterium]
MNELSSFFAEAAGLTDAQLDRLVPEADGNELAAAMRWSLFAGGKRFRPAMLLAAGRVCGATDQDLISSAASVELIHTYSLIHDDLPSMDDDDLRRGRETCHKRFGEATAILAGDALQALAFQTIATDERLNADLRVTLLSELGDAAACMVKGQHLDLESEGKEVDLAELERIHRNKTGALIRFAVVAGARIADADDGKIEVAARYGEKIGLLFQIVDDILDVTQTTESLGKTAGKDETSSKAAYPKIVGLETARQLAETISREAAELAAELGDNDGVLTEAAEYLLRRQS